MGTESDLPRGQPETPADAHARDYAFARGGEDDFAGLVRACCAGLNWRGIDTLIAIPDGAAGRGLYADPICF